MTIVETLLVFLGAPALAAGVLAALVYGSSARRSPRYRPGRGWSHEDVWYLPRPERSPAAAPGAPALTAGEPTLEAAPRTARGGASGSW